MPKKWKKEKSSIWSFLLFQIHSNSFSGIHKIHTPRNQVPGSMEGEMDEM